MSLLTDKEILEALKPVGITPGNVLYEASRAIEQAVMTKLLEQNEPFAWACWSDGDTEQKPIDCYLSTDEPTAYPIRKKLFTHPAPSAPGTGSEIASKLKLLAMNWCNEHAQPVVCGSLNQKELYALIDQACIGVDSPPSAPEGWQQFSHTLKYLIGTWRDGKGMFPQGSDKYDESIAAAHLLLKEADWQQDR